MQEDVKISAKFSVQENCYVLYIWIFLCKKLEIYVITNEYSKRFAILYKLSAKIFQTKHETSYNNTENKFIRVLLKQKLLYLHW